MSNSLNPMGDGQDLYNGSEMVPTNKSHSHPNIDRDSLHLGLQYVLYDSIRLGIDR